MSDFINTVGDEWDGTVSDCLNHVWCYKDEDEEDGTVSNGKNVGDEGEVAVPDGS